MKILISIFYFSLFIFMLGTHGNWIDDAMLAHLQKVMSRGVKPTNVTTVYVMADLYQLIAVDERAQLLTTKLWLYTLYSFDELAWDLEKIPIEAYETSTSNVWIPDMFLLNSVSYEDFVYDKAILLHPRIVALSIPMTVTTLCSFDITDFPWDTQTCTLDYGQWLMAEVIPYEIRPVLPEDKMALSLYRINSQWELTGTHAGLVNETSVLENGYFLYYRFSIYLKRNPKFYVNTLVIPCIMLSCMACLPMFLPAESGEKLGLVVTLLLAQIVNLLILSSLIPVTSVSFPWLGEYFLVTIGMLMISLVHNTFILNLSLGVGSRKAPRWAVRLLGCQARKNVFEIELTDSSLTNLNHDAGHSLSKDTQCLVKAIDRMTDLTKNQITAEEIHEEWTQLALTLDRGVGIAFIIALAIIHIVYFA